MVLPVTLSIAAAAAVLNLWHMMRLGQTRHRFKVSVGDGGNEVLTRRMRAHLNFAENTPLVLILLALVELAGKGGHWLAWVGGVYIVARVLHVFGMDMPSPNAPRGIGVMVTMLVQLGLAAVAVLIVLGRF